MVEVRVVLPGESPFVVDFGDVRVQAVGVEIGPALLTWDDDGPVVRVSGMVSVEVGEDAGL